MRILFVTARPPWPGRRGDQARTAGLAEELAARHTVHVLAQRWPGFPRAEPPVEGPSLETVDVGRLGQLGSLVRNRERPLQVALHGHRRFRRTVQRTVEAFEPDVVVVVLSRLGDVVEVLDRVPVVLDLVDALALNMVQRGQRQRWLRRLWLHEAQRIQSWDRELVARVSLAAVVSERDRRVVVGTDETLADRVRVVPFGLRLERSDPQAVARRPIVSLTGNLGYFPTVDGALWFADRVWPRVLRRRPDAEWWLAGSRPSRAIRNLARRPGVRLIPHPETLDSIFHQTAVAVAPLKSGSGTPIKILEAMAHRVPVVTTSTGRAGLDDLALHAISSADTAEAFARRVVDLLDQPDRAHRSTQAAWNWLWSRHERRTVADLFESLLEEAVGGVG